MKNRLRPRPCMECMGKFQTGGFPSTSNPIWEEIPSLGTTPVQAPTYPGSPGIIINPKGGATNEGALNRGEVPDTPTQDQYAIDPNKKKKNPIDPYFAFRGFTNGLAWLSGIVDRRRQNQYMQAQYNNLAQEDAYPVENFQPNPFSLYAKYGGSLKKYQQNDQDANDLIKDKAALSIFLRGENIQYKKGGRFMGINPEHKGWCTPMTKSTCTGARRRLALTLKKHHGFHEEEKLGGLTANKAREILHDGTVHGKKLTEKQRRFFGAMSKGHTNKF